MHLICTGAAGAASRHRNKTSVKQTSLSFQDYHQIFCVWPRSSGSMRKWARLEASFPAGKDAFMSGSWRDILESATANPAIDRDRVRPRPVQQRPASQGLQRRPPVHPYSAAEARGLLERELAAFSAGPLDHRPAPPLVRPAEDRPAAGRGPAARQQRVPCTQERVPYTSLMAALSSATPAMLTEAEKSAPPVRTRSLRSPKRLPWRSVLAISLLAMTVGLSAYALLSRGGKDAGTSQTGQIPSAANSDGVWVNIPLPSRRPSALRGGQSPGRGRPGSAAN